MMHRLTWVLAWTVLTLSGAALAQPADEPAGPPKPEVKAAQPFVEYPDEDAITYHTITVEGKTVHYQARAGAVSLVDDKYKETAKLFFISYRAMTGPKADDAEPEFPDPSTRAITFSFNGGPGSSSVWLHLGLYGPKRVDYADDFGHPGPPPYHVVDNAHSLLDKSDFVFIDPVSTGYSRAQGDANPKDFHGLEEDAKSVAEFIRLFITRNERWASPKFITGESYGTTRAAALAPLLQDEHGIALNGVILVSAVLNFQTLRSSIGNDLPHLLYVPAFAATARFHKKLADQYTIMPMRQFMDDVERWVISEFTPAMMMGDALPNDRRHAIAQQLAAYTGLSTSYVENINLRLDVGPFNKELLRDQRLTVGRLDARFTGIDRNASGDQYSYDPAYAAIQGIYTATMNDYVRRDLGYKSDLPYEILTSVWPWTYGQAGQARYVNVADRLRIAMTENPHLRVFLACGYYDLATPPFAADYTFNTMQLDPGARSRLETHYYEAGHMMYVHRPSLDQLRKDLAAYYDRALTEAGGGSK
ncbi:MAG: hypothetical protein KDA20_09855 [Phycisphaerales bacterium]|nr:hypothetical protein [Phycisphaerales bacterium]